jgi:hypothetical protein
MLPQSDATLFESLRKLQLMQLSVSSLKVHILDSFMIYLLFLRLVCFCSLAVNSYGLFRLLRLGGLLIVCGSTTHSRFAALCVLSLSKFLFFYCNYL